MQQRALFKRTKYSIKLLLVISNHFRGFVTSTLANGRIDVIGQLFESWKPNAERDTRSAKEDDLTIIHRSDQIVWNISTVREKFHFEILKGADLHSTGAGDAKQGIKKMEYGARGYSPTIGLVMYSRPVLVLDEKVRNLLFASQLLLVQRQVKKAIEFLEAPEPSCMLDKKEDRLTRESFSLHEKVPSRGW